MGLRHLIVVNDSHAVSGIITRLDILEHRLEFHTFDEEEQNFFKQVNRDKERKVVFENEDMVIYANEANGNSEHNAQAFAPDLSKNNASNTDNEQLLSSSTSINANNAKKNTDLITVKYRRNTVTDISHEPIFDPSSLLEKQTLREAPNTTNTRGSDSIESGITLRTSATPLTLPPPSASNSRAASRTREPKETSGNQW